MTALTSEELLDWIERTSSGWRQLIADSPATLSFPCDVMDTGTVARLLQHIMAAELRYAQRLHGLPGSSYEDISCDTGEQLYAAHDRAMELLRSLLAQQSFAWDESIDFNTRRAGTMRAPRRAVFVHLLMHSVRHYAQLATIVRQHGTKTDWPMDYLFMKAEPVPGA